MGCGASTDAIANEDRAMVQPLAPRNPPVAIFSADSGRTTFVVPMHISSPRTRKQQSLLAPHRGFRCTREFAAMLPERLVEEHEPAATVECPICATALGGCVAVTLPCFHLYHKDCAVRWLTRYEGSCPECRTKISPESFEPPAAALMDVEEPVATHEGDWTSPARAADVTSEATTPPDVSPDAPAAMLPEEEAPALDVGLSLGGILVESVIRAAASQAILAVDNDDDVRVE